MKVHLANFDPKRTGGGWTFMRNFAKEMGNELGTYDESPIYFIAGPTLVSREQVEQAKKDGKRIVLRLDNAVRNSRNRGTGMSRMKDFADMSHLVIYQSEWAKGFLKPFVKKDGAVILNGVDLTVFHAGNPNKGTYLYVRSSRDEGKQWIMAWYWFVQNYVKSDYPHHLDIVGQFSMDNIEYNFDFYNEERFTYRGLVRDMAPVYRDNKYFLYTYLNDACSNTLLEARASGCEIIDVYGMLKTGGAPEIMALPDLADLSIHRMCEQYREEFRKL